METKRNIKIVIVEDDKYYNKALTKYVSTICNPLSFPGFNFEIKSFMNAHECLENYDDDTNLMILDYYLINKDDPEILTGEDIILEVKKNCPECKFIMLSEQNSAHKTSEIIKHGVVEYIDKNVNDRNRLGSVLQKMFKEELRKSRSI